jgi:hypothetical protein
VDDRSGRLTLLWPGRAAEYRERFGVFDPAAFARKRIASGKVDPGGGCRVG